jgi:DNA polymerase-3 subunit delta'
MSFATLSGNRGPDHGPAELLQRSLAHGRLGHAYLLTGSRLDLLEAWARALAKTILCANRPLVPAIGAPLPDGCDACDHCRRIEREVHADVQWLRPESKLRVITIQQIRDLLQSIVLKPGTASHKVAVLVAADRLNVQSANAFLKTLEEPPGEAVLILLSTDPDRLLPTILSRCLRVNVEPLGLALPDLADLDWLRRGWGEGQGDGSVLERYRLLGNLLQHLETLRAGIERTVGADSPLEQNEEADPRLIERWRSELAAAVEAEYRRRRNTVLMAFEWWLRDVWMIKVAQGDPHLSLPELGSIALATAARIDAEAALENLKLLGATQRILNYNVQEALALEVGLLQLHL